MDEMYELSEEAVENGDYGFLAIWDDTYHAHGIFKGFGGDVFGGEDGDDVTDIGLDNEGAVEALEYMGKWYNEGFIPRIIIGDKSNDLVTVLVYTVTTIAVNDG